MRHKKPIPHWLAYSGYKSSLMNEVLDFIPKDTEIFVDVFGGTGIVSANVWNELGRNKKNRKLKHIYYNEIDWDLANLLAFMAENDPDEIIEYYVKAREHWFPGAKRLNDENKDNWHRLLHYLDNSKIQFDRTKKEVEHKSKINIAKHELYQSGYLTKEEIQELDKINNPYILLLFIVKNAKSQTLSYSDDGQHNNTSPQYGDYFRQQESIRPFLECWHEMYEQDVLTIFSQNFNKFHIHNYNHARKRPKSIPPHRRGNLLLNKLTRGEMQNYRSVFSMDNSIEKILENANDKTFFYLDPPYYGANAKYNKYWTIANELELLSLVELLEQKGIPYLLNNNLRYKNGIFRAWLDAGRWGQGKQGYTKRIYLCEKTYAGKCDNDGIDCEVFVTNQDFQSNKNLNKSLIKVKWDMPVMKFAKKHFGIKD